MVPARSTTQGARHPLVKEYTLNHIRLYQFGVLFVGGVFSRAPLLGVYIMAPDFLETPIRIPNMI